MERSWRERLPLNVLAGRNPLLITSLALAAGLVALAVLVPGFASSANLENVLVQTSYLSVFAVAQSLPLLARGFDLSLGATVSIVSVTSALVIHIALPLGVPAAILIGLLFGLAIGALIGLVNGTLIGMAGLNPFIVTLGTWNILAGIASLVSGGFPVVTPPELNVWLAQMRVANIPIPIFGMIGVSLLFWFLLTRSVLGRKLVTIGSNPRAADVAGINRRATTVVVYVLCSCIVSIGALMLTARTGAGEPNLGANLTLQAIAAAVVGGISLRGGEGRSFSPFVGAIVMTVLSNCLNIFRVDGYLQNIVLGLIIIGSVCSMQTRR